MIKEFKKKLDKLIENKEYKKAFEICYIEVNLKGNDKDIEIYNYMAFIQLSVHNDNCFNSMRVPVFVRDNFSDYPIDFFTHIYSFVIEYFDKIIEIDPNNIEAHYNRGISKYNIGKYFEALEDLDIVINSVSNNNIAIEEILYLVRSNSRYYIGDYNGAIEDIDKAMEYDSIHKLMLVNNKINCLINLEKFDEAYEYDKKYNKEEFSEKFIRELPKELTIDDFINPYILSNRAYIYYKKGLEDYRKILSEAIRIFNKRIANPMHINRQSIFFNLFRMSEVLSKEDLVVLDNMLDKEFMIFIDYNIKDNILFNYAKIDFETIKSISNAKIWLSNPSRFNDPIDPFLKTYNDKYKYFIDKIKVACLTTDNANTLMWSHYADKHQGICIGYDISINSLSKSKLNMIKSIYDKYIMNLNNIFTINDSNKKYIKQEDLSTSHELLELFVYKSKEWEYENEYRILYNDKDMKYQEGFRADLPIKSICFGAMTKEEDKKFIYKLLKDKDVVFYQAEFDKIEPLKINIVTYNE